MINYDEMSEFEINKQVAESLGLAVMDEQYHHYGDRDENVVLVENDATAGEGVDYCNVHDHAYPIMEKLGMVLIIDGPACIPKLKIKHQCKGKLLRAAMICFLKAEATQ